MSTSLHAMSTHFFTFYDGIVIGIWLEGFLYGKLYVLCAYNLSNYYSQRLYSGIFFMYLKCQSNKSRKATIVFYALYVLYVPSYNIFSLYLLLLFFLLITFTWLGHHTNNNFGVGLVGIVN